MSPRSYTFLCLLFVVSAGVLWLGGVFTLTVLIVYGFIAFGLVFGGMMCVLPCVVSDPPITKAKALSPKKAPKTRFAEAGASAGRSYLPAGLRAL